MPETVEFFLAGPVRGKQRVKRAGAGTHSYTPKETVNYEARLAHAAQLAMAGRQPFEGPMGLRVVARFAVPPSKPKRFREAALRGDVLPTVTPDADNLMKIVADGINLVVWVDDRQIVDATVRKEYSETPGMWVRVWQIVPNVEGIFG